MLYKKEHTIKVLFRLHPCCLDRVHDMIPHQPAESYVVSSAAAAAEEDKKVLDACEKWLQQAEALVIEADAKIEGIMHQDSGNLLAEEWVTFVHKYSMQIKDIEQVRRKPLLVYHKSQGFDSFQQGCSC